MQYWSDLYKELAQKITDNLSEIHWCDLWHEQINYLATELPFPTPAVFISFTTMDIEDKGILSQTCNTQIDFYLFYETFSDTYTGAYNQDTALDFLNHLTELHKLFHGTSGDNYTQMRRVDLRREESGDAGNLYRISFHAIVDDTSAVKDYQNKEVNDITIERVAEITNKERYITFEVDV